MCNFAIAGIISVTYIRKRIFALFHYVNLDTSLMNIGIKWKSALLGLYSYLYTKYIQVGYHFLVLFSRESKPYTEDEVR